VEHLPALLPGGPARRLRLRAPDATARAGTTGATAPGAARAGAVDAADHSVASRRQDPPAALGHRRAPLRAARRNGADGAGLVRAARSETAGRPGRRPRRLLAVCAVEPRVAARPAGVSDVDRATVVDPGTGVVLVGRVRAVLR